LFLRNITMLGGALLIGYFGADPLSLDALLTARKPPVTRDLLEEFFCGRPGLR
jgi:hypothetical protein